MHARHTVFTGLPRGEVEERARTIAADLAPWLWRFDGHRGLVLLVDEEQGRCVAISLWDDEHQLERSGLSVERMRTSIAEMLGASVEEASTYAVAHWDVSDLHG